MNEMSISLHISLNRSIAFVSALSFFTLASSLTLEMFFDLASCRLCNVQRILFFLMAVISLIGIFIHRKIFVLWLMAFLSSCCCVLAAYHLCVQLGLVIDPCIVNIPKDMEAFKHALFGSPVHCSKILLVAGIPISVWSFLLSLSCFAITGNVLLRCRKSISFS